jgi:hypothetical protein
MALTIEDGSAKADADSYSEVADAQTYYTNMGYSDTPTEATMRRGSRWIDANFQARLKGTRATSGQSMQLPRDGMTDEDGNLISSDTVPTRWIYAMYEVARSVSVSMTVEESKSIRRVKAGSVEVEFATAQDEAATLAYVNDLVASYLRSGNRVTRGA